MVAIEATEAEAAESIAGKEAELSIAAINGPTSIVISGEQRPSRQIRAELGGAGPKDQAPRRLPRLPLAPDRADAGGVRRPSQGPSASASRQIPIVSNVSGELLAPSRPPTPPTGCAHVREPVRFADGDRHPPRAGGQHLPGARPRPGALRDGAGVPPTRRPRSPSPRPCARGAPRPETLIGAVATAHAPGAKLDWDAFFGGAAPSAVPLPTYPFQRKRYWLVRPRRRAIPPRPGSPTPITRCWAPPSPLAGEGSCCSPAASPSRPTPGWPTTPSPARSCSPAPPSSSWRCEPGRRWGPHNGRGADPAGAADPPRAGSGRDPGGGLEGLARTAAARSRSTPAPSSARGRKPKGGPPTPGACSPPSPTRPAEPLDAWPPAGAEPIEVEDLYERLAEAGLEYGPAFQGPAAAWRAGEEVFAEVSLPEEQDSEAQRFGIHPALLDAALHGLAASETGSMEGPRLPFSWGGVSLRASGATRLRARLLRAGEGGVSLSLADEEGMPVARVGALSMRALDPTQLESGRSRADGLMGVEWRPLALTGGGEEADIAELAADPSQDTAAPARAALALVQRWLDSESESEGKRLAIVTEGAVAAAPGDSPDPAMAAALGLLRSAQAEHPGAFA